MSDYWEERIGGLSKDDVRTAYERDYARLVHSASFRRLQAKTQVLGLGDSDFYRTRLTHSLEVSQIGEIIAQKLQREHSDNEDLHGILPDPTLIRTVCLAHDLGHPPFGHGGEIALNRCMLDHGGFEGNGQTLRQMAKLEPYSAEHGMNLTRRTLLGVLKYPAKYSLVNNKGFYPDLEKHDGSIFKSKKYKPPKCYLGTEQDVVDWIAKGELSDDWAHFSKTKSLGETEHHKTIYKALDTSIMELADDIAYGVHDLEDALSLKLVSKRQFERDMPSDRIQHYLTTTEQDYSRFVENLFSDNTSQRKLEIGRLVGYFVNHIEVQSQIDEFSHPIFKNNIILSDEVAAVLQSLKDFVYFDVIKTTAVQQLEFKGQKIVTELFETLMVDPERLLTKREYEKTKQTHTSLERIVCDHIAGMTDEYATKRYQQLFEPRVGSVFDRL